MHDYQFFEDYPGGPSVICVHSLDPSSMVCTRCHQTAADIDEYGIVTCHQPLSRDYIAITRDVAGG